MILPSFLKYDCLTVAAVYLFVMADVTPIACAERLILPLSIEERRGVARCCLLLLLPLFTMTSLSDPSSVVPYSTPRMDPLLSVSFESSDPSDGRESMTDYVASFSPELDRARVGISTSPFVESSPAFFKRTLLPPFTPTSFSICECVSTMECPRRGGGGG